MIPIADIWNKVTLQLVLKMCCVCVCVCVCERVSVSITGIRFWIFDFVPRPGEMTFWSKSVRGGEWRGLYNINTYIMYSTIRDFGRSILLRCASLRFIPDVRYLLWSNARRARVHDVTDTGQSSTISYYNDMQIIKIYNDCNNMHNTAENRPQGGARPGAIFLSEVRAGAPLTHA